MQSVLGRGHSITYLCTECMLSESLQQANLSLWPSEIIVSPRVLPLLELWMR